jgi:DNA end-binding protein Ku
MDIRTFVDLDDIDPLYFNKAYFLGPGGEETGKLYALLREAMGSAGKAAVASFVMRGKEYLAAVRADGDILVLETLFFADEVRDPYQQIPDLPGRVKLSRQELSMARQLIDAMSGPWKPADYRDTYTDRVNDLIDAKKHKKEFQPAEEAPAATNVIDLTEALQSSVEAARKRSGRKAPRAPRGPLPPAPWRRSSRRRPGPTNPAPAAQAGRRRPGAHVRRKPQPCRGPVRR